MRLSRHFWVFFLAFSNGLNASDISCLWELGKNLKVIQYRDRMDVTTRCIVSCLSPLYALMLFVFVENWFCHQTCFKVSICFFPTLCLLLLLFYIVMYIDLRFFFWKSADICGWYIWYGRVLVPIARFYLLFFLFIYLLANV